MPNSVIYRQAGEDDLERLVELRWDLRTELHPPAPDITWEEFRAACLDFLRQALASGAWAFWVAERDGQILANAYVQRIRKVPNPGRLDPEFGYVTNVYTCPQARSQGIGAGLMRCIQDWAREQRLEMLILWPSERSGSFYRRVGFHPSPEALEWDVKQN